MGRVIPDARGIPLPVSMYSDKTSLGALSHRSAYPVGISPGFVIEERRRIGKLLALVGLLPVVKLKADVKGGSASLLNWTVDVP